MWLLIQKPNAFRLLLIIADRARRKNGHPDGLKIGQCQLGDYESYGLTEREYRTAKEILVSRKIVKICETSRTRKKSTNGTTTSGTLVQLLDSRIWDINSETTDERIDERPTNDRRTTDDEQEGIRKNKKEKEGLPPTPSSPKIKFRELVELTLGEHDSLLSKHGQEFLDLMLDKLDAFKGSKGKTYKSDFHTMKEGGWVSDQVKKDLQSKNSKVVNIQGVDRRTKDIDGNPVENQYEGRF